MALPQLTVKERILLHLFDFNRFAEAYEVPLEVTQSGIASAVGIRVQHATQYLKPLVAEEHVVEGVRHIRRQPRRRKAYFLTPAGRREASHLRSSLFEEPVRFRHRSGRSEELTLAHVYQEERRGDPLLGLIRELDEAGFLTEASEAGPSETVDFSTEAPSVDHFYGREEELAAVLDALAEVPVVVVTGIAGIGKSTLAAQVLETVRGEESLFWREVRPWDTPSDLGLRLGAFLQALGRDGLHDHLLSGGSMDLNRVEEILAGDLVGVPTLLVFDDVHDASPDGQAFFAMLHRALRHGEGEARALLLSRTRPSFYGATEAELGSTLREIPLKGLSEATSREFLADQGMAEDVASSLVPVSGGSPLFLKLLAKAAQAGGVEGARTSLEAHIAEEIEPSLQEGEREAMQLASFYALPVPSQALLLGPNAEARNLVGLEARNLLDRLPDGRWTVHDFLRDYFSKSLSFDRRTDLSARAAAWLAEEADRLLVDRATEEAITVMENAVAVESAEGRRAAYNRQLAYLRETLGDWPRALEAYRLALPGFTDPLERATIQQRISYNLRIQGRFEEGRREIEAGLASLPSGPSVEAALLLLSRVVDEAWRGRREESIQTLNQVGEWLPNLPRDPLINFWWRDLMAVVTLEGASRGDLEEALGYVREAIEIYEGGKVQLYRMRHHVQSYIIAAWIYFMMGELEEALSHLDRGRADFEDSGGVVDRGNLLNVKGYILSEAQGRFEEAENLYDDALRLIKATNQEFRGFWFPLLFARLYRRQGRPEDARESLAFFLGRGEQLEPEDLLSAHALMARICVECEDPEAARAHLSQAEGLLQATASVASRFHVAWARGIVLSHQGKDQEARRGFQEALSLDPPPFRGVIMQQFVANEFHPAELSLDYGRFLAAAGEAEEARDVLTRALREAEAAARRPLAEALAAEIQSLRAPSGGKP